MGHLKCSLCGLAYMSLTHVFRHDHLWRYQLSSQMTRGPMHFGAAGLKECSVSAAYLLTQAVVREDSQTARGRGGGGVI